MKKLFFLTLALVATVLFTSCDQPNNVVPDSPAQFTITFDANGGIVTPETMEVTEDKVIGPLPIPTKNNSTFSTWQIDGKNITNNTIWEYTEDKTAKAVWDLDTYTVTFEANDGTGEKTTQTFTHGVSQNLTENTFTREGYAFLGWTNIAGSTSVMYTDKQSFSTTANTSLYAIWTNSFTITFNANGETGANYSHELAVDTAQNLPPLEFKIPSGKGFTGWNTSPDGSGTSYKNNASYTATEETTLYAIWTDDTIEYVSATVEGTVLTISPAIDGSTNQLKAAIALAVSPEDRGKITKIIIEQPENGARITPEEDLSFLFSDASWASFYTNLRAIEGLEHIDTSGVTDMAFMFSECSSLTSLDVSNWDTSKVTNMTGMFLGCSSLTSLDVSAWDTSKVESMNGVFVGCNFLTSLDVSDWDTSKVTDMAGMFLECSFLATLNLSNWNTSQVTRMGIMFQECRFLTNLDLSGWDTSLVIESHNMFDSCSNLLPENVITTDANIIEAIKNQIDALPSTGSGPAIT